MEKSQRRVADYPLHRLSNQPVFQTEIPPTASVDFVLTFASNRAAVEQLTLLPRITFAFCRSRRTPSEPSAVEIRVQTRPPDLPRGACSEVPTDS